MAREETATARDAVRRWRDFATTTTVTYRGATRTWAEHIAAPGGYSDEEQLVQPRAFPLFARQLLDFEVGMTLAAENTDRVGRPDFTPADAVTHPFVFETKSTNLGVALRGWDHQVLRYLRDSRQRIKRVVLTNLVGIRVLELDANEELREVLTVDLGALLAGDLDSAAGLGSARDFAEVLRLFRRQALGPDDKLARARAAPPWVPALETTDADWLSARLDSALLSLVVEVSAQINAGALVDEAKVSDAERTMIEAELRQLEWRIGDARDVPTRPLADYIGASQTSNAGKALAQYEAHVAYFCVTRMLLVRVFEDLNLLDPVLYDGGLDEWLKKLDDVIPDVIDHSFRRASESYPSLFDQRNAYTWFVPRREAYIEVVYELANTYLGAIESDILGSVYERLLARVDRKLLGQYYTPRDVIRLIWDLVDADELLKRAEDDGQPLRVLDIASGSGGFLVEGARRLRTRFQDQRAKGSGLSPHEWVRTTTRGLTGVEIQRFPAYLGELNLLIQLALGAAGNGRSAIPPLGILCHDTLATHNPVDLFGGGRKLPDNRGQFNDPARQRRYQELCDPSANEAWFDLAIGNPPYVGEKVAARMIARTREDMPYWDRYHALHMDYLSWFLILGISKLRNGGRFGFITSEYWLRATGATELRRFISQHCEVDRLVLFRDMRLFPDAPGHHSLVITGRRVVDPGELPSDAKGASPTHYPTVSFIQPRAARDPQLRNNALDDVRRAARSTVAVQSFRSQVSPGQLLGDSWSEVIMTREQIARRRRMRSLGEPVLAASEEGVISAADALKQRDRDRLPHATLARLDANNVKGIFVLSEQEVRTLGRLSNEERDRVRRIINISDVYAYACVPPDDGEQMLYLPDPKQLAKAGGNGDATFDFDAQMPTLAAHLGQFKPILEAKVKGYNEKRPWWTIHRGRPNIGVAEGEHERWAGYALTARWGEVHNLTVGLAPRRAIPQSALHALIPVPAASAAYLVGVFNSTPVQSLADALGPGMLRAEEIFDLGVPLLAPTDREAVEVAGYELADLVDDLVRNGSMRWPELPAALRADPSLSTFELSAWSPVATASARSGPLGGVGWIAEVVPAKGLRQPIRAVSVEETLFGTEVVAHGDGTRRQAFRVAHEDGRLTETLFALVRGAQASGIQLSDLAGVQVPTDAAELIQTCEADGDAVRVKLDRYRTLRAEIDQRVATYLNE